MIVKTIVQGLVAAGLIAAASLAWAEVAGPPLQATPDGGPAAATAAGDRGTGYLPAILGGRNDEHRDDEHRDDERDDEHRDDDERDDDDHEREGDDD